MLSIDNYDVEVALKVLRKSIARLTEKDELHTTAIAGLSLFRRTEPTEPITGIYEPSICLVAQGAKRVQLGDETYIYDENHSLITSVHLPTVVQVIEASQEKPYLGLRLTFDLRDVSQLMADSQLPAPRTQQSSRGMATGEVTLSLINAFQRLVELLDAEQDIPILAPVIQREIIYRLLVGDKGARLRQIATAGSQSQKIARVIEWLKGHFSQPLRIDDLAQQTSMSTSTLSSPLPLHDRAQSPPVPEAVATSGGPETDAGRPSRCGNRSVPGRLRKSVSIQS